MKLPYVAHGPLPSGHGTFDDHAFTHSLKHGHQTANIVPPLLSLLSFAPMGTNLMRYRYNVVEYAHRTAKAKTGL